MKIYIKTKKIIFFISLFFCFIITLSQNKDEKAKNNDEISKTEKKEKKKKTYSDIINEKAITDNKKSRWIIT